MNKIITKLLAAGILLLVGFGGTVSAATQNFGTLADGDTGLKWSFSGGAAAISDIYNLTLSETMSKVTLTYALMSSAAQNGIVSPGLTVESFDGYDATGNSLGSFLAPTNVGPGAGNHTEIFTLAAGSYSQFITGVFMPNGGIYSVSVGVQAVPVPGAAILFGSAVMAFGFISRRRKGITA